MMDSDDDNNDHDCVKYFEEKLLDDIEDNRKEAGFNLLELLQPVDSGKPNSLESSRNKNWSGASSFVEMIAVPVKSLKSKLNIIREIPIILATVDFVMDEKSCMFNCTDEIKLMGLYIIEEKQIHLVLDVLEQSPETRIMNSRYKVFRMILNGIVFFLLISCLITIFVLFKGYHTSIILRFAIAAVSLFGILSLFMTIGLKRLVATRQAQRQEAYHVILQKFNNSSTFRSSGIQFTCTEGGARVTMTLMDISGLRITKSIRSLKHVLYNSAQ